MASDRRAAVWGASGGIGQALVKALASSGDYRLVHAGCRKPVAPVSNTVKPFTFDLLDERSIATAASALTSVGPVDLIIVATGMLHDASGNWPEKSFGALTADAMVASFRVNTVGPALIAKHMIQAIPIHRRSVFVALSARVGSIGDNRLGGWHSYRASKTALNMVIANLAIELKRSRPNAIAVGLHPGTVDSGLPLPFQNGVADGKLFSPATSAKYLLSVIDGLTTAATGAVWAWDGQRITP